MELLDVSNQMSTDLAAQFDGLLRKEVAKHLGDGFALESLRGRLARCVEASQVETYFLDGKALISFWPPEFHYEGLTIRVTRNYKVL